MLTIPIESEPIARASVLALDSVGPSSGRCPWRMRFLVDGLSVSAFFRPPEEVGDSITSAEVSLVAASILCDLAGEVRPKEVDVKQRCLVPDFTEIFSDAVCALMAEEDAYWSRSGFLSPP